MSKGKKFDQGKPDLSLIPKVASERCAEAFMVGQTHYGRYNYCAGIEASRQIAAAKRHLDAWFDGEENCQKDGQHHLGSAMACCAMILRQMELGTLIDDRFIPGVTVDALPKVSAVCEASSEVEDFVQTLTTNELDSGFRYRVICRRPDGMELTSLCSWGMYQTAVRASDEYTKQFPQCTFLAVDTQGD